MKPTDGAYSQSENYDECFNFFLAHTDEKRKTIAWLRQFVEKLPSRKQFVDVGAGNGALTQVLAPYFGLSERFGGSSAASPRPGARGVAGDPSVEMAPGDW
jgi:hypothetical protein